MLHNRLNSSMTFILGNASLKHRDGVDPRLIEIDDLAITLTLVDYGHGPFSGLRTTADQVYLHSTGASPHCDGVKVKSRHQLGIALDSYAYVDGKASWEPEHLAMVGAAQLQAASMLGYRVKWGGLWKKKTGGIYGWDMPHLELIDEE
jgi:peptidoglycan L-alanyl-D-glutamate endopeptidase CwlK